MKKQFISTVEAAKVLGISRISVFKRIQKGEIKAIKIGGSYAIDPAQLGVSNREPDEKTKSEIKDAVTKAFGEYGEALKKLGRE